MCVKVGVVLFTHSHEQCICVPVPTSALLSPTSSRHLLLILAAFHQVYSNNNSCSAHGGNNNHNKKRFFETTVFPFFFLLSSLYPPRASMCASQVLVDKVDQLPYRQRWQHMLSYGKDGVNDTAVRDAIRELAASPEHAQRLLAAMALRGLAAALPADAALPEDLQATATALVMDLSPQIHKLVISLIVQHTSSVDALEALLDTVADEQFKLLCEAIDAHRTTRPLCAEALLGYSRRATIPKRKRELLTRHLSAETLNQTFSATPFWMLSGDVLQKVVLRKPLWAVQVLRSDLERHIQLDIIPSPLMHATRLTLQVLAETGVKENVELGLGLICGLFHRLPVAKREVEPVLTTYFNHATTQMIEYLLNGEGKQFLPLNLPFSNKTRALVENNFALRCTMSERSLIAWSVLTQFNRGSQAFREYVYTQRRSLLETSPGRLDASLVELLPLASDREREAREAYGVKELEEDPLTRMTYLNVLPFTEATKLADEYMTNPTPEFRIAAVGHLVATARFHPEQLSKILQMCVSRGKEQDPFRLAMLNALANLPGSVWREPHAAFIQDIMTAALAAKDISEQTINALKKVILSIAVRHHDVAAKCLMELYKERPQHRRGEQQWASFCRRASDEVIVNFYDALSPMIKPWLTSDIPTFYRFFAELPTRFVSVLKDTLHPFFIQQLNLQDTDPQKRDNAVHRNWGYQQLEKFFPREAQSLAPSLLEKDPTWFSTPGIKRHVVRDVQGSLLTPHLTPEPPRNPRGRPSLDVFRNYEVFFYRWSTAQQHQYARSLIEMVKISEKEMHNQKRYLALFPRIPSAGLDDGVGDFAVETNEDVFLRDWALVTMGRMQDKASFEELRRALTDSRQREAAVPMMCRLQKVPAAASIDVLRPALDSKLIMVQKEVARFIGDKADPVAFDCLRAFMEAKGDKLQQDVLLAVVRGLWNYMDQDITWSLLDTTVQSPRAAACIAICKIPDRVLAESWQQQRYMRLIVHCLKHSDNSVKLAAMKRLDGSPSLESPEVFVAVLSYVGEGASGRLEAMAVDYLLHAASVLPAQVAEKLLAARKATCLRRFVDDVRGALSNHTRGNAGAAKVQEIASLMARGLIDSRRLPEQAVRLVLALSPMQWMPFLTDMHASHLVHPQCAMTAVSLAGDYSPWDETFMKQIAQLEKEQLRTHTEPFFRRLGLALLEKRASRDAWSNDEDLCVLINTYRKDTDMWVRDAADLIDAPNRTINLEDEL